MQFDLPASTLIAATLLFAGCSSSNNPNMAQTPGDLTLQTSSALERQGDIMKDAEKMIVDGRATRERGLAMQEQGKVADAQELIAEGNAKIQRGQAMINQARQRRRDILQQARANDQKFDELYDQMNQNTQQQSREVSQMRPQFQSQSTHSRDQAAPASSTQQPDRSTPSSTSGSASDANAK